MAKKKPSTLESIYADTAKYLNAPLRAGVGLATANLRATQAMVDEQQAKQTGKRTLVHIHIRKTKPAR